MTAKATKTKLTLTLDADEALALMHLIGATRGELARRLPSYDEIANAMESGGMAEPTISAAMDAAGWSIAVNAAEILTA
jgi:hypothetical protein